MEIQPVINPAATELQTHDVLGTARALGELLSQNPEYRTFLEALKAVNNSLTVQKLSAEIRSHQTAMQWGRDAEGQHAAELTRLEMEMEDHPVVKAYHQAEKEVSALFHAVDEVISQAAGVPFAANAKRSGCGCGG
jgi:cell fate (sporulation/competence/biofilm development) regulator YlbF (YheA/YmcA/DUF963 family)